MLNAAGGGGSRIKHHCICIIRSAFESVTLAPVWRMGGERGQLGPVGILQASHDRAEARGRWYSTSSAPEMCHGLDPLAALIIPFVLFK